MRYFILYTHQFWDPIHARWRRALEERLPVQASEEQYRKAFRESFEWVFSKKSTLPSGTPLRRLRSPKQDRQVFFDAFDKAVPRIAVPQTVPLLRSVDVEMERDNRTWASLVAWLQTRMADVVASRLELDTDTFGSVTPWWFPITTSQFRWGSQDPPNKRLVLVPKIAGQLSLLEPGSQA